MENDSTVYVGLDVHKESITVAYAVGMGEVELLGRYVPGVEDEAFRDLARAWAAAKTDLKHARQRIKSFLLSHGVRYAGNANWGAAHRRWISTYAFPNPWQQLAFDECRRAIVLRFGLHALAQTIDVCLRGTDPTPVNAARS
jgi:hypothetical protein